MYLYLIQHGEAVGDDVDPARPLTKMGRMVVEETAGLMKKKGFKIDEVWHSVKLRAKQTAEIVGRALDLKNVLEKEGLKPNDPVAPIAKLINESKKNILITGHLPYLSKLTSLLVTGAEGKEVVVFEKGKLVCLEKSGDSWKAAS